MRVGIIVILDERLKENFQKLRALKMNSCQLVCWEERYLTAETARMIRKECEEQGVEITAFWCGWPGPCVWDFYDGQLTLGLVPAEFRFKRLHTLRRGSDFAKELGVDKLITHAGYIPEDPNHRTYHELIMALRDLVGYCAQNGQDFLFETGQETPVTLRRAMEDIGLKNVGVNLDPANLLMYGKANPVDALDILGPYVLGVHGKDGEYPATGHSLGEEKPIGQGRVNYPAFIRRLKEVGYDGDITIEREISGPEQERDIVMGKQFLNALGVL